MILNLSTLELARKRRKSSLKSNFKSQQSLTVRSPGLVISFKQLDSMGQTRTLNKCSLTKGKSLLKTLSNMNMTTRWLSLTWKMRNKTIQLLNQQKQILFWELLSQSRILCMSYQSESAVLPLIIIIYSNSKTLLLLRKNHVSLKKSQIFQQ